MNFAHRLLLPGLMLTCMALSSHAQEAAGEGDEKRVQYQLVLPEEKTPETVKPEEHNPFESETEALSRQSPGDTEENRVRDKLLRLPVVGTKRMADGRMRVMLGDIILETGHDVPRAAGPARRVEGEKHHPDTNRARLAGKTPHRPATEDHDHSDQHLPQSPLSDVRPDRN